MKEIKGVVKEIDKTTGDAKLQADSRTDKLESKYQTAVGSAKDTVRVALKKSDSLRPIKS